MGRFFKVASPNQLQDFVYQPPWELMKDVIKTHDTRIGEQEANLDKSDKLLADINNLKVDDPEVNRVIQGYRDDINKVTQDLQSDYSNYQQFIPEINRIKRRLQEDMDNGLLGRAQEAYKERETERSRLQGIKGADPKKVSEIMKFYDLNYAERGNLNFRDKENYNKYVFETLNPEDTFNTAKFLNDLQSHIEGNQTAYASSGPGSGYIWSKQGTKYSVDKNKVRSTLENHPELLKWESTTRQDIMLDAHNNLGLRGQTLDEYINATLSDRKEKFIQAGISQIVHDKETASARASADSKYMADQAYERRQAEKGSTFTEYEVEVDKRSEEEVTNDDSLLQRVSSRQLEGQGPLKTPQQVEDYIIENLPTMSVSLLAERLGESPKVLSRYVQGLKRRGVYTQLAQPGDEDYERNGTLKPDAKIRLAREEKALRNLVLNTDASEITTVETGTNYRVDSKISKATLAEAFNSGDIKPSTLGGEVVESTKTDLTPPVIRKDSNGNDIKVYLDEKGDPIEDSQGNYAKTPEEAERMAVTYGKKPMRQSKKVYTDTAGHSFKIVGESKVERFVGKVGKPQVQVTFTTRRLSDGKIREVRAIYPEDKYKANIR